MNKLLWMMLSILVALPIAANAAEVYKWKDKDGVIRYSDTPPPSNIEKLPVNGKKPVNATSREAVAPTESTPVAAPAEGAAPAVPAKPAANADSKKKPAGNLDAEAGKRQKDAEEEKKKNEQKEAELKQKQLNCANAKANAATYKRGGRISKATEGEEREYLGDKEIAENLQQAQKEVEQYCE